MYHYTLIRSHMNLYAALKIERKNAACGVQTGFFIAVRHLYIFKSLVSRN